MIDTLVDRSVDSGSIRRWYDRHRTEIRLFLTFLVVFALFMQWYGYNETTRLDLTRSLRHEGDLDITEYQYNTGDKLYIDGDYYSDKAPLSSFLGVPAALAAAPLDGASKGWARLGPDIGGRPVFAPLWQAASLRFSQILFVLVNGVLPGALLVVFLYRYLLRSREESTALATALVFGGATLLFGYAIVGNGAILAAFLGFLAFHLASGAEGRRDLAFAGFAGGLAVSAAYYAAIVPLLIAVVGYLERRREFLTPFIAGAAVGIAPTVMYLLTISGGRPEALVSAIATTPGATAPTVATADLARWGAPKMISEGFPFLPFIPFQASSPLVMAVLFVGHLLKLTVYPVKGMFFYSPVLLLALLGLRWRSDRWDGVFPAAVVGAALGVNALLVYWPAGASVGPRYVVPAIPFLAIPFARAWEIRPRLTRSATVLLVPISVINNLMATNGSLAQYAGTVSGQIGVDRAHLVAENRFATAPGIDTALAFLSPRSLKYLDDHFVRFLETGPRTQLVTTTLSHFPTDIRLRFWSGTFDIPLLQVGDDIMIYDTTWLFVPLLAMTVALLWRGEIVRRWRRMERPAAAGFLALLVVAVAVPVAVEPAANGYGFYPENRDRGAWMGDSAVYALPGEGRPLLTADIYPNIAGGEERTFRVEGDDGRILERTIRRGERIFGTVDPRTGMRTFRFSSALPCTISQAENDYRCLTFRVDDVDLTTFASAFRRFSQDDIGEPALFMEGVYPEGDSGRWMTDSGSMYVNLTGDERYLIVNVSVLDRPRGRRVTIRQEDTLLMNDTLLAEVSRRIIPVAPDQGLNRVDVGSPQRCREPAGDPRCLAVHLRSLEFLSGTELQERLRHDRITYSGDVYAADRADTRWIQNSTVAYLHRSESSEYISVDLAQPSYEESDRRISLTVNGVTVYRGTMYRMDGMVFEAPEQSGVNTLEIRGGPCTPEPGTDRCLSVGVRNISFLDAPAVMARVNDSPTDLVPARRAAPVESGLELGDGAVLYGNATREARYLAMTVERPSWAGRNQVDVVVDGEGYTVPVERRRSLIVPVNPRTGLNTFRVEDEGPALSLVNATFLTAEEAFDRFGVRTLAGSIPLPGTNGSATEYTAEGRSRFLLPGDAPGRFLEVSLDDVERPSQPVSIEVDGTVHVNGTVWGSESFLVPLRNVSGVHNVTVSTAAESRIDLALRRFLPVPVFGYGDGFYGQESVGGTDFRWMNASGRVLATVPPGTYNLTGRFTYAHNRTRDVRITVAGQRVATVTVPPGGRRFDIALPIHRERAGTVPLRFETDGCGVAGDGDGRCLSVALASLSLNAGIDIIEQVGDDGFFAVEHDGVGPFNWMRSPFSLPLLSLDGGSVTVAGRAASFNGNRTLVVSGRENRSFVIRRTWKDIRDTVPVAEGASRVRFASLGCERPSAVLNTSDDRCLSVKFRFLRAGSAE